MSASQLARQYHRASLYDVFLNKALPSELVRLIGQHYHARYCHDMMLYELNTIFREISFEATEALDEQLNFPHAWDGEYDSNDAYAPYEDRFDETSGDYEMYENWVNGWLHDANTLLGGVEDHRFDEYPKWMREE